MIAKKIALNINKLIKNPLQFPLQFLPDLCTACKGKNNGMIQSTVIATLKYNPAHHLILKIMVQTFFTHLQKMGFVWS